MPDIKRWPPDYGKSLDELKAEIMNMIPMLRQNHVEIMHQAYNDQEILYSDRELVDSLEDSELRMLHMQIKNTIQHYLEEV